MLQVKAMLVQHPQTMTSSAKRRRSSVVAILTDFYKDNICMLQDHWTKCENVRADCVEEKCASFSELDGFYLISWTHWMLTLLTEVKQNHVIIFMANY